MMRPATIDRDGLRSIVVARFPELAGSSFSVLGAGWDSVALAVDQWVFKFPRTAVAATALRREAGLLQQLAPAVDMPVPRMELLEAPTLFSRHHFIPGDHLLAEQYARLDETQRQMLGDALGLFYSQLHAIPAAVMTKAGALPAEQWFDSVAIERLAFSMLDDAERAWAKQLLARWDALGRDPHGDIYGYFDGHGWNMAFDHAAGRLNGLYDFADSGIGPLHQDFLYSSFISPDLTARIVTAYEHHSGRALDRERIALLTGVHRLWELAVTAGTSDANDMLLSVRAWMNRG